MRKLVFKWDGLVPPEEIYALLRFTSFLNIGANKSNLYPYPKYDEEIGWPEPFIRKWADDYLFSIQQFRDPPPQWQIPEDEIPLFVSRSYLVGADVELIEDTLTITL